MTVTDGSARRSSSGVSERGAFTSPDTRRGRDDRVAAARSGCDEEHLPVGVSSQSNHASGVSEVLRGREVRLEHGGGGGVGRRAAPREQQRRGLEEGATASTYPARRPGRQAPNGEALVEAGMNSDASQLRPRMSVSGNATSVVARWWKEHEALTAVSSPSRNTRRASYRRRCTTAPGDRGLPAHGAGARCARRGAAARSRRPPAGGGALPRRRRAPSARRARSRSCRARATPHPVEDETEAAEPEAAAETRERVEAAAPVPPPKLDSSPATPW